MFSLTLSKDAPLEQYLDLNQGIGTGFIHTALNLCAQHSLLAGSRPVLSQYKTLPLEVPAGSAASLHIVTSIFRQVVFHFGSLSDFFSRRHLMLVIIKQYGIF